MPGPAGPSILAPSSRRYSSLKIAQGLRRKITSYALKNGDPLTPALAKLCNAPLDVLPASKRDSSLRPVPPGAGFAQNDVCPQASADRMVGAIGSAAVFGVRRLDAALVAEALLRWFKSGNREAGETVLPSLPHSKAGPSPLPLSRWERVVEGRVRAQLVGTTTRHGLRMCLLDPQQLDVKDERRIGRSCAVAARGTT